MRWLPAAALLLAAPKCVVCVAAYIGLGAALGLNLGPELCGGSTALPLWVSLWLISSGIVSVLAVARLRRRRAVSA